MRSSRKAWWDLQNYFEGLMAAIAVSGTLLHRLYQENKPNIVFTERYRTDSYRVRIFLINQAVFQENYRY